MSVVLLGLFVIVSFRLLRFSRPWLRDPHSHGFWRFFAFESILVLILFALPGWRADPLCARQLLSWCMLAAGAALAIHGYLLLKREGQPVSFFENTTVMVERGAFRHIRHPMYGSLLLLIWGVFPKAPGWITGALALAATVFVYLTARAEEREMIGNYGDRYLSYRTRTRMFVPWVLCGVVAVFGPACTGELLFHDDDSAGVPADDDDADPPDGHPGGRIGVAFADEEFRVLLSDSNEEQ